MSETKKKTCPGCGQEYEPDGSDPSSGMMCPECWEREEKEGLPSLQRTHENAAKLTETFKDIRLETFKDIRRIFKIDKAGLPPEMIRWADDFEAKAVAEVEAVNPNNEVWTPEKLSKLSNILLRAVERYSQEFTARFKSFTEAVEREQYPRPPDRLTGAFTAGIAGALTPKERETIGGPELVLVSLQSTEKIKRREVTFRLPLDDRDKINNLLVWLNTDSPPEEIKKHVQEITAGLSPEQVNEAAREHLARVNQELAQLVGPRGLQLYRGLQRELYFNRINDIAHRSPLSAGGGLTFFVDEDRLLKAFYPGKNYRRTEHVQELQKLLARLTSGNIKVNTLQLFQDGKDLVEIRVNSPLFQQGAEIEITRIPEGKREQAETRRGTWLTIPEGALALFTWADTNFHAWGDPEFLAMDIATKRPYAVAAEDWIEEQLNIGWHCHGEKRAWSLDTILRELNLKDQYLYPNGDTSKKPLPRFKRNAWIRRFIGDLLWIFDKKYKRGLWKSALIKDPPSGRFMMITNFLKWLNTPAGKRALRIKGANTQGDAIEGALRFILQVKIGPEHKLNTRHKVTAEVRKKRAAAKKRRGRSKKRAAGRT